MKILDFSAVVKILENYGLNEFRVVVPIKCEKECRKLKHELNQAGFITYFSKTPHADLELNIVGRYEDS